MIFQEILQISQRDKGAYDITSLIADIIKESKITTGTCQIFSQDSSSSILIGDTASESTINGTADFLAQFAPSDESTADAINEGMEAIPEALKDIVQRNSLSIPVSSAKPGLGVWQGVYFWAQSDEQEERKITITVVGE